MTILDYQTLMLPVLRLAANGEKRVAEVEERIANDLGLTQEERDELLPSGRQRALNNRIHWAKFYMTRAGLLTLPARGRFIATEAGRALLADNPERIDVKLLLQRPEFREFYKSTNEASPDAAQGRDTTGPSGAAEATPEEQIETAYRSVLSALQADLLDRIGQNSPAFFEKLIVDLLVAMGYGGSHKNAAAQLGRSGDGGVDGSHERGIRHDLVV